MRFEHPDDDNARRPDGDAGAAAAPGAAGRQRDARLRLHGPAAAGVRADRLRPRLLPGGSVVPEDRGVRAGRRRGGRAAGGWNCHQFHANTEFYADYGRYRVEITVPRHVRRRRNGPAGRSPTQNADGTTTHTYEQDDVHDFAWTADPNFVEVKRTLLRRPRRDARGVRGDRAAPRPAARTKCGSPTSRSRCSCSRSHMPQARAAHLPRPSTRSSTSASGTAATRTRTLTVVDPAQGGDGLGGDGVPDPHHRRDAVPVQPLAPRPRPPAGGRDRPRVRPPVLVRARGEQRVRGGVAGRGHSPPTRRARPWMPRYGPDTSMASSSAFASARSKWLARRTGRDGVRPHPPAGLEVLVARQLRASTPTRARTRRSARSRGARRAARWRA